MHPATRELLGTVAYVSFMLYGSWRIARWSAPEATRERTRFVLAIACLVSGSVGLALAIVLNSRFQIDFCIYLILSVVTLGSTVGAHAGLWRDGGMRKHAMIAALAVGTLDVLLIPPFLL